MANENSSLLKSHSTRLDDQQRLICKESFERKLDSMNGKFAVYGYKWKIREFGTPSNAVRRQFIRKFFRSVLVNQGLLPPVGEGEEDFKADLITDLKPLGFRDDASFEMTIGNLSVFHAIKEKLPSSKLKIRLRPMQPKIISAMVDEALRHRRHLLDENPSRTLYVETKPFAPFVSLMERKAIIQRGVEETVREKLTVPWSDPRFNDPVMHHNEFSKASDENRSPKPSKSFRGRNNQARGAAAAAGTSATNDDKSGARKKSRKKNDSRQSNGSHNSLDDNDDDF